VLNEAKDDGGGGDNWNSSQIITTNKPTPSFLQPFLWPNQQCQSTEGKISHFMDLLTPSSPGVFLLLSLTANQSINQSFITQKQHKI